MAVSGFNVFPYLFNNWIPVNGEMEALLQNTATAHSECCHEGFVFFHLVSLGMALPSLACRDGVVVPGVSSSCHSLALGRSLGGERLWAVAGVTPAVTRPRTGLFRQHLALSRAIWYLAPNVLAAGSRAGLQAQGAHSRERC